MVMKIMQMTTMTTMRMTMMKIEMMMMITGLRDECKWWKREEAISVSIPELLVCIVLAEPTSGKGYLLMRIMMMMMKMMQQGCLLKGHTSRSKSLQLDQCNSASGQLRGTQAM